MFDKERPKGWPAPERSRCSLLSPRYRALGRIQDGVMYWFWIGNHDEYERLLKSLCPFSQMDKATV
jgi:hypothetical protein